MANYNLPRKGLIRQILLTVCGSIGLLTTGLLRGFSSPAIPSMMKTSPYLVPDSETISFITSIPMLGSVIGGLIVMPCMHYIGRKRVLQIVGPIYSISWIAIAVSDSSTVLILSRMFSGMAGGAAVPTTIVYVSECSHPKIRGLLASLPSVIMVVGVLVQFLFGYIMEWRGMAWITATFPAAITLVLIPFPEAPPWLKLNGKRGYKEAYEWYGLRPDLENAQEDDDADKKINLTDIELDNNQNQNQTKFLSRNVLIPLSLGLSTIIFQQTCGNDVVTFNTIMIFQASGITMDSYIASILFGVFHLIFAFASIFLVDKFGRKSLLIFSSIVMGISIGFLSLYFFLHEVGKASNLSFLPLTSLIIYIGGYSSGYCNIPLILLGELYPLSYRSLLCPLTISIGLLAMFIELKTYSNLVGHFSQGGAFTFYSIMNFTAAIFIYFLLPETKGKSLDEIESYFSKNRKIKMDKSIIKSRKRLPKS